MAKKKTNVATSLQDAINATLVKEDKKKPTGKFPVIDVPEMREHVDSHVDAKAVKKAAEAEIAFHGQIMADHVRPIMDNNGFSGKFAGTYVLKGNQHEVKVIFENKFTIKADDEDNIRAIIGNKFDELIEKRTTVKLKKEVLEDAELAKELMGLLGSRFVAFFESTIELAPRPNLKEDLYKAVNKDKLELLRQYVKQYNPSIK